MKKVKKYKISRRLQTPLFEKCQTQKFFFREQKRAPKMMRRAASDFGKQLTEKQKVRYLYGISENTLKNYVKRATDTKGMTDKLLSQFLERRLDNVVYRLGLVSTRRMARQAVSHGHFLVNGRRITVPSYQVTDNDVISIREGSQKTKLFKDALSGGSIQPIVPWVAWDRKAMQGTIQGEPALDEGIFSLPVVLEYYSR